MYVAYTVDGYPGSLVPFVAITPIPTLIHTEREIKKKDRNRAPDWG